MTNLDEFLRRAGVRAQTDTVVAVLFCAAVLAIILIGAICAGR